MRRVVHEGDYLGWNEMMCYTLRAIREMVGVFDLISEIRKDRVVL